MKDSIKTQVTVQIDTDLLRTVYEMEKDFSKVISEALNSWAKKRLLKCPMTNDFCDNIHGQCNKCSRTKSRTVLFS